MFVLADATSVTTVADVATAVGTILAVIAALWLQWGLVRLRQPRLQLSLGRQSGGVTLGQGVAGYVSRIRLQVTAAAGRRTAHQVEVLASAAFPVISKPEWEILLVDREPLKWFGSRAEHGPVTQISLAPGISREVSLACIGRPLDLYQSIGMSRPTDQDVERADSSEINGSITDAFGVFDVPPPEGSVTPFLHKHLVYKLRIDVTAQDIDTVSYETEIRVQPVWLGNGLGQAGQSVPTTHAARNKDPVRIDVSWTPL